MSNFTRLIIGCLAFCTVATVFAQDAPNELPRLLPPPQQVQQFPDLAPEAIVPETPSVPLSASRQPTPLPNPEMLSPDVPIGPPVPSDPIAVSAYQSHTWMEQGREIWMLQGRCEIRQGGSSLTADRMVLFEQILSDDIQTHELQVYAEGNVRLQSEGQDIRQNSLEMVLQSTAGIDRQFAHQLKNQSGKNDPLYARATNTGMQSREETEPTFLQLPVLSPEQGPALGDIFPEPIVQSGRKVIISPRSLGVGFNLDSQITTNTSPPEQVLTITQGVNIVVEGIAGSQVIDLTADNIVLWTVANADGTVALEMLQQPDAPLQLYLEGNIEVRQGGNLLQATHAFYDLREDRAVLYNAELRVDLPEVEGQLRLRASRIRQMHRDAYHAQQAWVTTSEFGKPTYRLESSDIYLENRYGEQWVRPEDMIVDQRTGQVMTKPRPWLTSLNNTIKIGEVPVFVAPHLSGPAEDPNIPIRNLTIGQDGVRGFYFRTEWDISKLFGFDTPAGLDWNLDLNMYSDRGILLGTNADYRFNSFLGMPGLTRGNLEANWIHDHGDDNLGLDRRDLEPEQKDRGRFSWRHRQELGYGTTLFGEVGYLSDRNYLNQYYENEWDQQKDQETYLRLEQSIENMIWTVQGQPRVNDFEYQTEWLPRADLAVLGEPLFGTPLIWSMRSSVGYGRFHEANAPNNPNDLFSPIPYFNDAEGVVATTRHELSLPFQLGAVKVAPYVLGEAAYWEEDANGNSLDRLYGQAGIRTSISFWKVFPYVRSGLFNLNGLAHKQTVGLEYSFSDSTEDLNNVPLYNEFDDDAQERYRTRLLQNSFGGVLPGIYDPRMYAVRTGAGSHVTSPYHELVDDQQVLRLTWMHRLQTKVGPPDRLRTKDWMTLGLGLSYFPDDQDNFGEELGLLTANYKWDIGARTQLLANGQFDFFDDAPSIWDVGLLSQRSTRGSIYVGYRELKAGLIKSQTITGSVSYAMSPKWIATLGTAYDVAEGEDRGQSMTVTRAFPDFLLHVGATYDRSKNNAGFAFSIEPRLGPLSTSSTQLGSLLGIR